MTNPITDPKQAGERLLTFARENRLVQKKWHDNVDGREFACLLGAAAGIDDASQCPASLMPTWLAEVLPVLFDSLQKAKAMSFARRWGRAMVRDEWPLIDWNAVRKQWLAFVVQQAKTAADAAHAAKPAAAAAAFYAANADADADAKCAAGAAVIAAFYAYAANADADADAFYAAARLAQADALMDAIAAAMANAKEAT